MVGYCGSVLFLVLVGWFCDITPAAKEPSAAGLSVLMVSPNMAGHLPPMILIGQEMSRRGHNVTLLTETSDRIQETIRTSKITLWSTGCDPIDPKKLAGEIPLNKTGDTFSSIFALKSKMESFHSSMYAMFTAKPSPLKDFHIIIFDFFHTPVLEWVTQRYTEIPVITLWTSPPFQVPWVYLGKDASFLKRLQYTVFGNILTPLFKIAWPEGPARTSAEAGLYNPAIVASSIGFDHPKPHYPMTHFVGSMIPVNDHGLDTELRQWLDYHKPGTVLYISTGSIHQMNYDFAMALYKVSIQEGYDLLSSNSMVYKGQLEHCSNI